LASSFQTKLEDSVGYVDKFTTQAKAQASQGKKLVATTAHSDAVSSLTTQATSIRNSEAEKVLRMAAFVEGGTSKSTSVIRNAEAAIPTFSSSLKESTAALQASTTEQASSVASGLASLDSQATQVVTQVSESLQTGASSISSFESAEKTGLHSLQSSVSRLLEHQFQVTSQNNNNKASVHRAKLFISFLFSFPFVP
jgi:hypothetical protein